MTDRSNLRQTIDLLLEKYTIEEIVFTLYCYAEDNGRNDNELSSKLKKQAKILSQACDLLEESDNDQDRDDYFIVY
jgi:hypothetical protein